MELVALPARPSDWDQRISAFDTKCLFHESAWLDFDLCSHPQATAEYFSVEHHGVTQGYFCAMRRSKVMIKAYQSPFSGRGVYLSPIVNRNLDPTEFVAALLRHCQNRRIGFLELSDDWFPPEIMARFGFEAVPNITHLCPLHGGSEAIWARMRGTCRTRIRKAEKAGLVAEATTDAKVTGVFQDVFVRVLARRGLKPSYGVELPTQMMTQLGSRDRVFSVGVRLGGEMIGAGFYPHDDRVLYFWDGASHPDYLHLSPNELLHWKAIQLAADRGIAEFRIGGGPVPSRFTEKFGGGPVPVIVYQKFLTAFARCARRVHNWLHGVNAWSGQRLAQYGPRPSEMIA